MPNFSQKISYLNKPLSNISDEIITLILELRLGKGLSKQEMIPLVKNYLTKWEHDNSYIYDTNEI